MSNYPQQMDLIGSELAIRWQDGQEQFIELKHLRQECPCGYGKGEPDIIGGVETPVKHQPLTEESYRLVSINPVGRYALQLTWGDGHSAGVYSYEYLRSLNSK